MKTQHVDIIIVYFLAEKLAVTSINLSLKSA